MSNFFGYPTFQRKFGSYVSLPLGIFLQALTISVDDQY